MNERLEIRQAASQALPWKQLQQHSDVTNFTPSDIYWHHLWNFGADNNSHAKRAASTTLAQSVGSGWHQVAALLNNFGYAFRLRAGKQWFAAPFSRSHSGSRWRAGSWTSALFSSWPGLRGEGAPGGLRGRRGHRGDSSTYGDISEQWVTDSVQILINPRGWKRPLRISIFLLTFSDQVLYIRISDSSMHSPRLFLPAYLWPVTFTALPELNFPYVLCVSEDKGGQQDNRIYFTLQDVFNSSLKPKSYGLQWISGQDRDAAFCSGCTTQTLYSVL